MDREQLLNEVETNYMVLSQTEYNEELEMLPELFNFENNFKEFGMDNAIIGWSEQDFSHGYQESFYKIAQLAVVNTNGQEDYYIYSIMFNYRQYLELALKELLFELQLTLGQPICFIPNHNLKHLLQEISIILKNHSISEILPKHIKNAVTEFYKLDTKNDRFRYAYQNNGETSFDYDPVFINYRNIAYGMRIIHEWFDSVFTLLNDGSLANIYCTPSYKYFTSLAYKVLIGKSSNQMKNLLKDIKFSFNKTIYKDLKNDKEIVTEKFIYFDVKSLEADQECRSFLIKTNYGIPYRIFYEKNKIIEFTTVSNFSIES